MPTNTPNLNLIKPLVSEHYDVVVANANNDILDTEVANKAPKANPIFTGTQTLPNIVTNGIKFPATQVPSSDPNTLDDYEEGTFTPTIIGLTTIGTGNVYATQVGHYTKIGNTINVFGRVSLSTKGNATGGVLIGSLPFLPKNITARVKSFISVVSGVTGTTLDNVHGSYTTTAHSQGVVVLANSAGSVIDFSNVTNSTLIDFEVMYLVA